MKYEALTFSVPELTGISRETIDEHIGLYNGYVKHVNLIHEKIDSLSKDPEANSYAIGELRRRLGFEFGGMRNHEYYFTQFENGPEPLPAGKLRDLIEREWGTVDAWEETFRRIALTRGVGWAMMYHDPHTDQLVHAWVDEQHLGQLADLDLVLALDMWEHSYMLDYPPSRKKEYVDAFFKNLNWGVVGNRLT